MITLAFDSVAKVASVAVLDGERALAVYSIDNGLTQSELLMPMARDALTSLGMSFDDVELLACTVGPGSFTGVRIGVSLVKGIAFGRDIPCVGVSALEALAENLAGLDGIIVPCMDARRGQVYTAIFDGRGDGIKRMSEDEAIPLDELCERLRAFEGRAIYITGDGYKVARAATDAAGIRVAEVPRLLVNENAYSCGVIAARKHTAGDTVSDMQIQPTYLRLPQAERERLQRINSDENKK